MEIQADKAFCRQLEAASCLQTLVLMGNSNHTDICRRDNAAAQRKRSRRFLECIDDTFLTQVIKKLKRGILLALIHSYKEGFVGAVKVKGSLGCSAHGIVEFRI